MRAKSVHGTRPRVAIDATQLAVRGKGISRYLTQILPGLAAAADDLELVVLAPEGAVLPEGADALALETIRSRPAIVWEQIRLPRLAASRKFALLHWVADRLPVVGSPPAVLYLFEDPRHRATGSTQPRHRLADALTAGLFPRTLRKAALVLVSSEATRRDVLARGVPEPLVRVVYPGIGERFQPADGASALADVRLRLGLPHGFVLHFSSDDRRENSGVALEAYAAAADRAPELPPLLIAGSVSDGLERQQELAARLGIRDRVVWRGWVSEEELRDLYRGATAYLDPSLYEGFGFQVGEALASGAPVVCSNTTSLPEVVGDAGLLFDPGDVRGLGEALAEVASRPELELRLRRDGPLQAGRFQWSEAARGTVQAWREVLGLPPA